MKKKVLSIIAVLLMCIFVTVPAWASAQGENLFNIVDGAQILTEDEFRDLEIKAEDFSRNNKFDVIIVTLESLDGYEAGEAAEELYDQAKYGYGEEHDGVILLISMEQRDWAISSSGFGQKAINSRAIDYLEKQIVPELKEGNYAKAIEVFIDESESLYTMASTGHAYRGPFSPVKKIFFSLIIGIVVGSIVVSVLTAQLKTVHAKTRAAEYVVPGSLDIKVARERFLYRTVTSRKIEKSSSSSSGGGHTTKSGKF